MDNLPYVATLDLSIEECFKKELHEWLDEILPTFFVRTAREKFCNAQFSAQRQRVDAENKAFDNLKLKKKSNNDESSKQSYTNTGNFSGSSNTPWVDIEADPVCLGKGKAMKYSPFTHESLPSSRVKPRLPKAISLIAGRTFGPIGEHYYYSDAISVPEIPEIPSRLHYVVPAPFRISPLRLSANSTFVEN